MIVAHPRSTSQAVRRQEGHGGGLRDLIGPRGHRLVHDHRSHRGLRPAARPVQMLRHWLEHRHLNHLLLLLLLLRH